ncbi:alpha/beta hydrolase-fold protein [Natronomonas amylolytica]|uniref:alpha/beta hydrolase-fold protein n=1 Tax=Natronomonas amylolytica TaxID=3108498 RepID=UPI00300AAF85
MSDESTGRGERGPSLPRPGPDALYGPNPTPPQLENGFGWDADPLLVSGCDAYVDGEYLYQDYVYDDHGADTRSVFDQPPEGNTMGGFYCRATGDYRYPSDPDSYGYNAADLLEFRARPTDDGIAYRITLNTMLEPDAAAVAIGIDTEADPEATGSDDGDDRRTDWGYGLGELGAPVDHRLVTWGTGAELDGHPLDDDRLDVDVRRNQIEIEVPLDPADETWRHYVAVGLWDADGERFQEVAADADESVPGGRKRGLDAPPIFNVGFRFDEQEPMARNVDLETLVPRVATVVANTPRELLEELESPFETLQRLGAAANVAEDFEDPLDLLNPLGNPLAPFGTTAVSDLVSDLEELWPLSDVAGIPRVLGVGNWREHRQAQALAERDISEFGADIDFATLREGTTERNVPESGFVSYLYPSRHDFGAGVDPHANVLKGRIQPYGAYIPEDIEADEPVPMVTALHSLGNCYTQYRVWMPGYVEALAEATGGVVFMPQTRGPGIWYKRRAELDVFEAWRDLERRVDIDRSQVSVAGYSMGGFGATIMATKHPDCFGRCFAVVGPPAEDPLEGPTGNLLATPSLLMQDLFGGEGGGRLLSVFTEQPENALRLTENLRHVPMLLWHGGTDALVPLLGPANYANRLRSHGYRHEIDVFPTADHFLIAIQDYWERGPEYLAETDQPAFPKRVTFRYVPEFDYPDLDIRHDGAHWVTDIEAKAGHGSALVDATSLADGYADPDAETFSATGTKPLPYTARGVEWDGHGAETERGPANALELSLEGVESATLWIEAAGLDPEVELTIEAEADTAATLTLRGSFGARDVTVDRGESTVTVGPLT